MDAIFKTFTFVMVMTAIGLTIIIGLTTVNKISQQYSQVNATLSTSQVSYSIIEFFPALIIVIVVATILTLFVRLFTGDDEDEEDEEEVDEEEEDKPYIAERNVTPIDVKEFE